MKYTISKKRLIELTETLIHLVYPKFNKEDTEVITWSGGDETYLEYFDKKRGGRPFAKYWIWKNELQLDSDLFFTLEKYLGEEMTNVIDWFNVEFNQDAETVTY